MSKIKKILQLISNPFFLKHVFREVYACTEHVKLLKSIGGINTFIDIGSNRGQFALVARYTNISSTIYSFEPQSEPASKYKMIFKADKNAILFQSAIGLKEEEKKMYISKRDDSSSILEIGANQTTIFPGTQTSSAKLIKVAPLHRFLSKRDLVNDVFVKIDVQGYELEVLKGITKYIKSFDYLYVECSFIELYEGQSLAYEVIQYLNSFSFILKGIYNTHYDRNGIAIQGDMLFMKDQK